MVLDHAGGHDHPPDDHGHDDSSHSDHGHLDHSHGDHGHGHERHRDPPHGHRHGGRWHSHAPLPAVDGNRPRLRTLLLTGLAGGMVPTPSAVVVLLGAMTLGRASFGILLVIAYGLGMAATLVGVGYLLDRSLRPLLRRLHRTAPRLSSTVLLVGPVVSALAVVGAGSFLVLRAGLPLLDVT